MRIRPLFVLIVMALGLGLPASAAAQSAGDDQYADPFEETPAQGEPVGAPTDGGASEPAPTAAPAAGTTAPTATATGTGTLPRTGFDLVLLLVTGAVLLLSGLTVRRVLTGPYTAAR